MIGELVPGSLAAGEQSPGVERKQQREENRRTTCSKSCLQEPVDQLEIWVTAWGWEEKPALLLSGRAHTNLQPHVQFRRKNRLCSKNATHAHLQHAHKLSQQATCAFVAAPSLALIDIWKPSAAPRILHVTLATEQGQPQKLKMRNKTFRESLPTNKNRPVE